MAREHRLAMLTFNDAELGETKCVFSPEPVAPSAPLTQKQQAASLDAMVRQQVSDLTGGAIAPDKVKLPKPPSNYMPPDTGESFDG